MDKRKFDEGKMLLEEIMYLNHLKDSLESDKELRIEAGLGCKIDQDTFNLDLRLLKADLKAGILKLVNVKIKELQIKFEVL